MIKTLKMILLPFKSWFTVDTRILGIYRIFLGLLAFSDILRRWDVRHIFYSVNGIVPQSTSSVGTYKSHSLLHTFNAPWEITLFFTIICPTHIAYSQITKDNSLIIFFSCN